MSLYASHHHCFAVAAFAILPLEKISVQSTSTILYLCLVSSSMLIIPSSHIKKCLGRPARFHAWSKQRATWPVKCHQNFLGAMKAISSGGSLCGTDRLMKLQYQKTSSLVYSSTNRYCLNKAIAAAAPSRQGLKKRCLLTPILTRNIYKTKQKRSTFLKCLHNIRNRYHLHLTRKRC